MRLKILWLAWILAAFGALHSNVWVRLSLWLLSLLLAAWCLFLVEGGTLIGVTVVDLSGLKSSPPGSTPAPNNLSLYIDSFRKALRPFAEMDRDGCDLSEQACMRGTGFDKTTIFSSDFRRAKEALDLPQIDLEQVYVLETAYQLAELGQWETLHGYLAAQTGRTVRIEEIREKLKTPEGQG